MLEAVSHFSRKSLVNRSSSRPPRVKQRYPCLVIAKHIICNSLWIKVTAKLTMNKNTNNSNVLIIVIIIISYYRCIIVNHIDHFHQDFVLKSAPPSCKQGGALELNVRCSWIRKCGSRGSERT